MAVGMARVLAYRCIGIPTYSCFGSSDFRGMLRKPSHDAPSKRPSTGPGLAQMSIRQLSIRYRAFAIFLFQCLFSGGFGVLVSDIRKSAQFGCRTLSFDSDATHLR